MIKFDTTIATLYDMHVSCTYELEKQMDASFLTPGELVSRRLIELVQLYKFDDANPIDRDTLVGAVADRFYYGTDYVWNIYNDMVENGQLVETMPGFWRRLSNAMALKSTPPNVTLP